MIIQTLEHTLLRSEIKQFNTLKFKRTWITTNDVLFAMLVSLFLFDLFGW